MQQRFYVYPGGVKIHYLEYGTSGPDVLLIPGITSPAITWGDVGRRLGRDAHVIVMDVRGRGLSDQRPGLGHDLDHYAADAAGLIAELRLAAPSVIGHSMGARIAIRLASRYPRLPGGLVLVDPPVSGPGRRPYPNPLAPYLAAIDDATRGLPLNNPAGYPDAYMCLRAEWLATCSTEAVTLSHRGFHEEDVFGDLPRITCPATLLFAERGDTVREADVAEMRSLNPALASRRLEGVGHMMHLDDIEIFIDAIHDCLQAVPSGHAGETS